MLRVDRRADPRVGSATGSPNAGASRILGDRFDRGGAKRGRAARIGLIGDEPVRTGDRDAVGDRELSDEHPIVDGQSVRVEGPGGPPRIVQGEVAGEIVGLLAERRREDEQEVEVPVGRTDGDAGVPARLGRENLGARGRGHVAIVRASPFLLPPLGRVRATT